MCVFGYTEEEAITVGEMFTGGGPATLHSPKKVRIQTMAKKREGLLKF